MQNWYDSKTFQNIKAKRNATILQLNCFSYPLRCYNYSYYKKLVELF